MADNIINLIQSLIFDKNSWYLIGTIGTFIVTVITLWLKYGNGINQVILKIEKLDKTNEEAHKVLMGKIDENSKITKEYSSKRNYYNILENIKNEAINWSPKKFNNFITIKARSMRNFFVEIEKIGFNNVSVDVLDSELNIAVNSFISEAKQNGYDEFVDYFIDRSHSKYTTEYMRDLKEYKKGKINNLNEAFLSRSVVFYRHALENAINTWSEWVQLKRKENNNNNNKKIKVI